MFFSREQRASEVLYREGGQRHMAAEVTHMLQPAGPPALQELRPDGGEAQLRDRRDRRVRPGVKRPQPFLNHCTANQLFATQSFIFAKLDKVSLYFFNKRLD